MNSTNYLQSQDNYLAWSISEKEFPKESTIEEKIRFFTRFGILAPSTHNTQPWKFKVQKNSLFIYPDLSKKLPFGDRTDKNLYISLGCCLENISKTSLYFGFDPNIEDLRNEEGKSYVKITFTKKREEGNNEKILEIIKNR